MNDKRTILVVEDEALLRIVVVEILQEAGYAVLQAPDGASGCEIMKTGAPIDLLISDIKMPGMSGYDVARECLQMKPEMRVMLMTGYAQEPLPDNMRNSGIEVIHKPFDFDEFVKKVQRKLEIAGGA
jgi:DNA-binding NtrC family response regulator